MAIIEFTFNHDRIPDGAIGVRGHHESAGFDRYVDGGYINFHGPQVYWTWLTHVGLCLQDSERNGYHDSDFFMTVWNEEKNEPETILFATTRGWSYPAYGSKPDATPEVRAKYDAWCAARQVERAARERCSRIRAKLDRRNTLRSAAQKAGFGYAAFLRMGKVHSRDDVDRIAKLCGQNLRSEFKKKLRAQVVEWALNPTPKYRTPLSAKQLASV